MGGYLAGRLRTKWASIHSDEVYFRDTAHGFLAWAVGVVITAAFLTSAAASIVGASVALDRGPVAAAAMTAPAAEPWAGSTADAAAAQSAMQERAQAQTAGRVAAEMARSAAAKASLWLFVALLTGAFCASLAATFGGRQRDRVRAAEGYEKEAYR